MEELVKLLVTAEGITEEQARAVVATMVEEGIDLAAIADLYERALAGEDLGSDATTFAAIRNEVGTVVAESGDQPRAQEVLRQQFDALVASEFTEISPLDQKVLDQVFRQMFSDFRSSGRTDFPVFYDEQFEAISLDVEQQALLTAQVEEADAREQARIASAQQSVATLRIPEAVKAQVISDAVRQADAEELAGDVTPQRFDEIVGGLVDGLLNASPTAALELEAEAAGEDPLALSQMRRFDQNITDREAQDKAAFGNFIQDLGKIDFSDASLEKLGKIDFSEAELRRLFAEESSRRLDEQALTQQRQASALTRARVASGTTPDQLLQEQLGREGVTTFGAPTGSRTPAPGPGIPGFGQTAAQPFSFGDFLQQRVGSLKTEDEALRRSQRVSRTNRPFQVTR